MSGGSDNTPVTTDFTAALSNGQYQIGLNLFQQRGDPAQVSFYRDATFELSYIVRSCPTVALASLDLGAASTALAPVAVLMTVAAYGDFGPAADETDMEGGAPEDAQVAVTIGPKIQSPLGPRGWTVASINEAIATGVKVPCRNKANGNLATRYIHAVTGQSVVVDNVTNEVIHVGGPGFLYGPGSGDL